MKNTEKGRFSRNLGSVVSFRVTPDERKRLEDRALKDDRDVASTIRAMLRQHLADEKQAR